MYVGHIAEIEKNTVPKEIRRRLTSVSEELVENGVEISSIISSTVSLYAFFFSLLFPSLSLVSFWHFPYSRLSPLFDSQHSELRFCTYKTSSIEKMDSVREVHAAHLFFGLDLTELVVADNFCNGLLLYGLSIFRGKSKRDKCYDIPAFRDIE